MNRRIAQTIFFMFVVLAKVQHVGAQQLKDAVENNHRLVGYTLYEKETQLGRAMVLDLDLDPATGNSFEVFPNLNVIQQKPIGSTFEGWLPDKRAIIAVYAGDLSLEDFYIVNFSTREFFTPTFVAGWGPVASVQPYGRDGKTGYFLTAQRSPADCYRQYHQESDRLAPCSQLYQIHADGSRMPLSAPGGLDPVGGSTKINSHGCPMSPDGKYKVCERTGKGSTFQVIQITQIEPFRGSAGEAIQPVGIGAWWSPDSTGFIYYSEPSKGAGANESNLSINFSPASGAEQLRIRIGCRKQDCSPNDAPNKYFVHASSKIGETCDGEIIGGSDVGQWSNDPDGNTLYTSMLFKAANPTIKSDAYLSNPELPTISNLLPP